MNSLLEDIIGFARSNLEKAGLEFKASLDRDRALIDAYKRGGQIDPAQRQAMAEEYINQANPMSAVGGMIKPSTWAKYTPEAKATMTEVANRSPQKFQEVLEHPNDLMVKMDPYLPDNVLGRYRPGAVVSATVDKPASISLSPTSHMRESRIPEHELTHYLNDQPGSRFYKTDAEDAWTIGRLLQSQLPFESRGSLDKVIRQSTNPPNADKPTTIFGSGWDKIEEFFGLNPDARPLRKDMGPITYSTSGYTAMDEGLAHLADAAARKGASPEIKKLAREMGVSWEDKTKEVLFGGPNSPKWNPRDVPMVDSRMLSRIKPSVDIPRAKTSEGGLALFEELLRKIKE